MAVKKSSTSTGDKTTARICSWCSTETFAYEEIKTKRGTRFCIFKNCVRGACKNGQDY